MTDHNTCDYCKKYQLSDCRGYSIQCGECALTYCLEYENEGPHPLEFMAECSCCHKDFCSDCISSILEKQENKCTDCLQCKNKCHYGCECECSEEEEDHIH